MSMADKIAIMSNGVIEQYGTPEEVYNRPATMFVADFVGSPPMNLLGFGGRLSRGDRSIAIGGAEQAVPEIGEDMPEGDYVLGARPEHLRLADDGPIRAVVYGSEYLGTTQIVTFDTPHGPARARLSADLSLRPGEAVALRLVPDRLSIFDKASGRAIRTALHGEAGGAHG
jgi:multiple sugar transport system ATP-binding protein